MIAPLAAALVLAAPGGIVVTSQGVTARAELGTHCLTGSDASVCADARYDPAPPGALPICPRGRLTLPARVAAATYLAIFVDYGRETGYAHFALGVRARERCR